MLIAMRSVAWLTRIFRGVLEIGIVFVGRFNITKTNVFCSRKKILQTSICKRDFKHISIALHFKNFLHWFERALVNANCRLLVCLALQYADEHL